MKDRLTSTMMRASKGDAIARDAGMFTITAIMMTTRMRGASG
jgi:hypothetical protein